jgi:hypothetical protein
MVSSDEAASLVIGADHREVECALQRREIKSISQPHPDHHRSACPLQSPFKQGQHTSRQARATLDLQGALKRIE